MILSNSQKIKALEIENQDLKNALHKIHDKEQKVKQLEEVHRRIQNELVLLVDQKKQISDELEELNRQKIETKDVLEKLKFEIKNADKTKIEILNSFSTDQEDHFIELSGDTIPAEHTTGKLKEIEERITEARNKKDNLIGENIRLEESLNEILERINNLKNEEKSLNNQITRLKSELKPSGSDKELNIKEKLSGLAEKIEELKTRGKAELNEIQTRIKQLTNEENALQDRVNLRMRELEELENTTIKDSSAYKKASEEKLLSLVLEEQKLIESLEKKQNEIKKLDEKISQLKQLEVKASKDFELQFETLKSKEIELKGNISLLQSEFNEISRAKEESEQIEVNLDALRQQEQNLIDKITQLNETEQIKKAAIDELADKISAREIELVALSKDYEKQSSLLNEINIKIQELNDEIGIKQKELLSVVQSINSKTDNLKKLQNEIEQFEEKLSELKNGAEKYENINSEVQNNIQHAKSELNKVIEEKNKISALVSSLQKRKSEVLLSNKSLEDRFAELFQRFNKEINQTNQKRNVLEQIIQKKEKDIDEKDQILTEKINALDEAERVLNLRQAEIDSFDDLLKTINEQKELLKNDLLKLDDSVSEKRIINKDMTMETEFLQKKMQEIEKSIRDLLSTSDVRYEKSTDRRAMLDGEIKEYESRLNELNIQIKDSMNELVDLRTSINRIKLEHEEHRLSIVKFSALKKKLDEEIKKNQTLLNKYRQIREKIKIERTTMAKLKESPDYESEISDEQLKALTSKNYSEIFKL
jgi:chromosome segregation ATPase